MNMKKQKISLQVFFLALICCALCACQTDNALSQTTQPQKSLQQLLEEQPIDDTHDAFLIDTGGELGTLLVAAELAMENKDEFGTRSGSNTACDISERDAQYLNCPYSSSHSQ